MPNQQLARGLWTQFANNEAPFNVPNGMEENLRVVDDHLGLYTLAVPQAPGTPFPENPADGDGQIYLDGSYAVYNGGAWKSYAYRPGMKVVMADASDIWLSTATGGWLSMRMNAALDVALLPGKVFPTTVVGVATVNDGDYFTVPSALSTEFVILYRRQGDAATEIKRYPTAETMYAARDTAVAKAAIATAQADIAVNAAGTATASAAASQLLHDSFSAVYGGIGYQPPVAYAAGISLELVTQTVEYAGEVYAPKFANLPFVTSGIFEAEKFRFIQGSAGNFFSTDYQENVDYGPELITTQVNWTLGAGWSNSGGQFVHTMGQVSPLVYAMGAVAGSRYQVAITISSPSTSKISNSGFMLSIGGSVPFEMYEGNFTFHTYERGITAIGAGNLTIAPESQFDGTVVSVSVREIIGTTGATQIIKDSSNSTSFELRPLAAALNNVFIGRSNAQYNTTGHENTSVGVASMGQNTTGFWNSSLGFMNLEQNTVGSRNVAIGYIALKNNIDGHRNIAIGPFAMLNNKHGHNNVAIGADCMSDMESGSHNIAIGLAALITSKTGKENIAIGQASLTSLLASDNNIAIGDYAASSLVASPVNRATTAVGHDSARQSTAAPNVAFGQYALKENVTGDRNIAIGNDALKNVTTSAQNLVIGVDACPGTAGSSLTRNLVIGHGAGAAMTTGANYNVLLGYNAGSTITTGNNNILLGYNVQLTNAADTYKMNIGNLLYGKLAASLRNIGIDVEEPSSRLHLPAGASGAGRAPIKFSIGTLQITPENGTFEFDGSKLYATIQGIRRPFASVDGISQRAAGDGGEITQAIGKDNMVTLTRVTGKIITNASALAAGAAVKFNFFNTYITANDILMLTIDASSVTSPENYNVWAGVSAGSAAITVKNVSGASLSEPVAINFAIIRGATT